MTGVIREYEVKLTVRVALREPIYGKGEPPYKPAFTPATAEVSEAVKEVLTMEEAAIVFRPSAELHRPKDMVSIDFESVAVNFAAGAPPGFLDADRSKGEEAACVALLERARRREQDDIAKHAEQRSVENDERNKDG